MVLCMIPVSFAATTTIDNDSYDLAVSVIAKDGGIQGEWITKDDSNSITFEYDYEDADDVEAVETGKFTEDAKMAMVKVSGFMKLDSVDEITVDGKKLEVNDKAVYAKRVNANKQSLTSDPAYLLFPIELTKSGYTDTYLIEVTGTVTTADNKKITIKQIATISVEMVNTSEYKNGKTATISRIRSLERQRVNAYIVSDRIYLDFVGTEDQVKSKNFSNILEITFRDNNGDLFDAVTWAYSPSSAKSSESSIFKVEGDGGVKLSNSKAKYSIMMLNRTDADYFKDVVFQLETASTIYETKEYDVQVRYEIKETDPKGIVFAESEKTIKVGEEYAPVVLGVKTNSQVDAGLTAGQYTDKQVIDFKDTDDDDILDTVIGTQEGVAYITASYKPAGVNVTYNSENSMKIVVTTGSVDDDEDKDDDKDGKTYMVTASSLRVRSGAGTNFSQIGSLKNGATVKVESIANGWAKLENGGYVSAQYLAEVVDNGEAQTMYVTARTLNVRKGPGTSYAKAGTLSRGTAVQVVGFSGNWAKLSNGYYVSTSYLAK